MKESNLTFAQGFLGIQAQMAREKGAPHKVFDWDIAASIIREEFKNHPDLVAEAGLEGDWKYTGGTIFEDGNPITGSYTYLASNWAIPTLILSWDGKEQISYECFADQSGSRFDSDSKWDDKALSILNAKSIIS